MSLFDSETMEKSSCKVCVTGGAGYIGSWLVKKLLEKGYIVHATLRNSNDPLKAGLLKSFPGADTRLVLFEADIYYPNQFDGAIEGCEFVFHVATPLQHTESHHQYKNIIEASIAGAKSIAMSCVRSGTVRRLIYTASVVSASPLKEDGTGFKDFIDETCWTPLDLSFANSDHFLPGYRESKTLTEKEILRFGNNENGGGLEVVSLACGLVCGDTLQSFTSLSTAVVVSQLTDNAYLYQGVRYLEELLGKVPIIHIDDLCEAHIFCMENPSTNGRFLCAGSYVSSAEIADYFRQTYPEFHVKQECLDVPQRQIEWNFTKLIEKGFEYKYDIKMILDDCIKCAIRMGDLKQ